MAEGFNLIFTKANFLFMMNGLLMTILISIGTIFLSMIFGTILALLRHFCTGKWAWLSGLTGVYIEFFRCTPNILWILWIRFTIKGNPLVLAIFACTLFTTAVAMFFPPATIMRRSQGFSFFQTLFYIVLPQTYKSIIPAMLSQVITVIKDTSFLKVVDIAEFMRNSYVVMGKLSAPAHIIMLYSFIALCYFIICFSLSCGVRYYQKKVLSAART